MLQVRVFCLLAVTLQCLGTTVVGVQPIKIISIVSNTSTKNTPLWARGEEIIPGALLAAQQLNSNQNILSGFHMEVAPLSAQDCSVSEGILKMVETLLSTDNPVIGVTGLFCHKLVTTLSPLLEYKEIGLIQISGDLVSSLTQDQQHLHFHPIVMGIETQIESLINLMKSLSWTKINLVRGQTFSERAEVIENTLSERLLKIELEIEVDNFISTESVIKQLVKSTSPIIVAILPPETAADLLCHAFKNKLTWPRYGWIMLDFTVNQSAQCEGETLLRAMENVIVLNTSFENNNSTLVSNITYSSYVQRISQLYTSPTGTHNPYANVLYDSVWALALALNSSLPALEQNNQTLKSKTRFGTLNKQATQIIQENLLNTRFTGATGNFKNGFIQTSIEIYQIQNELLVLLGSYKNSSLLHLELLNGNKPHDEIPSVYEFVPFAATISILIIIGLCLLFVTTLLVLFLCSWKKPEVHASSRRLSLCIFLGSYFTLISAFSHILSGGIFINPDVPVCVIRLGTCFIGLDLILATVLARTLRIAYVFTKFKKTGKACSDNALLSMIAGIVMGKIVLFLVWSASDYYRIVDIRELSTDFDGLLYFSVSQRCSSHHLTLWFIITIAYSLAIFIPLLIVAYRTRKIKRKEFKDTKKINSLFVTLIGIYAISLPLWWVFQIVGLYHVSIYIASIGYAAIPVFCQTFLILPKVAPALKLKRAS